MVKENYGIDDIKSLSFREGVRDRIQMYLGSDDLDGTYQAFKEIINNSTDEAIAGFGKKIEITVSEKNNSIRVRDYGRGVPFGKREDGENVLVSIYSKSHTGGKFEEGAYKNSSGLNGIGAKCVCLSSKYFCVSSYRDGTMAQADFDQGNLKTYQELVTKEANGTEIYFIPDPAVFKTGKIGYTFDRVCEDIKNISYLYKGLKFEITDADTKKKITYCAKNGIPDYIKDNLTTPINKVINYYKVSDGTDELEIAYQWGSRGEMSVVFVNGLLCSEGGSPVPAARTAITRTINNLAGTKLSGEAIRNNLFYVINCNVANPSFANQTKTKINNESLRGLANQAFSESLKEYQLKNGEDFQKVIDYFGKIEKAEAAAERARQQVLNTNKETERANKAKISDSTKLRDARKLGKDATLLVVEGDSAGGSMSIGRDPNKYGILMLRGKAKNLMNCTLEEGLENEEVKLMLQALGISIGKANNLDKLRYGKVAIASDADFDGSHIGLLIMAMLHVLCPELIKSNRLYWLRAPICKVETSAKNYYYYSEEEFATHPKGEITFYKGLGQMSDEDLAESMFNEEWQHLEPITYNNEGIELLQELMGSAVEPRKQFIMNNIDFTTFTVE